MHVHGLARTLGYNVRFPNDEHRTLNKSLFKVNRYRYSLNRITLFLTILK